MLEVGWSSLARIESKHHLQSFTCRVKCRWYGQNQADGQRKSTNIDDGIGGRKVEKHIGLYVNAKSEVSNVSKAKSENQIKRGRCSSGFAPGFG